MKKRTLSKKQENFCLAMLTAKSAREAYMSSYNCTPRDASANASRLLAQPHIAARLQELRDRAATEQVMKRREGLVVLSEIGRSRLTDYLNPDGSIDIQKAATGGPEIEELQQIVTARGRHVKLKIRDPVKAIERLAKLSGWDKQTVPEGVTFNLHLGGCEETLEGTDA